MSNAVLLIGHGTRSEKGIEEFMYYVDGLSDEIDVPIYHAFLEHETPEVSVALEQMYADGITRIIVLPVFLFVGVHIMNDLPQIFGDFLQNHHDVDIQMLPYLHKADFLVPFYQAELENRCNKPNQELLLIGVGGSIKFTNDELVEMSTSIVPDWMQSKLGFLSKVTAPHWLDILKTMKIERNILICPIVLFYGRYMQSIENVVSDFNAQGATIELMSHIGKNKILLNHLVKRIENCI